MNGTPQASARRLNMARRTATVPVSAFLMVLSFHPALMHAQENPKATPPFVSCDEFLPARKQMGNRTIGPAECRIVADEIVFNARRQPYRHLELRISGTLDGWVAEGGRRFNYFNDGPEFVFSQSGNTAPRHRGIGRYEASTGHGISLFLPQNVSDWNRKLFVTAHGAGAYEPVGVLLPREPNAAFNPLANANRYVGSMMDRGFAVAHTLRSSQMQGGDVAVKLDDGRSVENCNISSHVGFLLGFTQIAHNSIQKHLGRIPVRTYYYGMSAGGFLGRLVQYKPGLNRIGEGRPVFDAFLLDDAGSGLWHPVLMADGQDTLFTRADDKARFVPQIDVTHQLAGGSTYLENKRENARILQKKGLGDKHRMYEIRQLGHFDAGYVRRSDLVSQAFDIGELMGSLIDALDRWVENGEPPPPTRSDTLDLGLVDSGGINRYSGISLPEVACPLGVYYGRTPQAQETGFAAFDGVNVEPIDGDGRLVDMNGNGRRDRRETVVQAWSRLRLLKPDEPFTPAKYVACVAEATAKLVNEGFLPARVIPYYVQKALAAGVPDQGR